MSTYSREQGRIHSDIKVDRPHRTDRTACPPLLPFPYQPVAKFATCSIMVERSAAAATKKPNGEDAHTNPRHRPLTKQTRTNTQSHRRKENKKRSPPAPRGRAAPVPTPLSLGEPSLLFRFYPHRRQHDLHVFLSFREPKHCHHTRRGLFPLFPDWKRERETATCTMTIAKGLRGRVTGRFSKLLGALAPAAMCLHVHQTPTAGSKGF